MSKAYEQLVLYKSASDAGFADHVAKFAMLSPNSGIWISKLGDGPVVSISDPEKLEKTYRN